MKKLTSGKIVVLFFILILTVFSSCGSLTSAEMAVSGGDYEAAVQKPQ
jgi:hypothetical protein